MDNDRKAEFGWRKDIKEKEEQRNAYRNEVNKNQEPLNLEVLEKKTNELIAMYQQMGNNWKQELITEREEEVKGMFKTKKEIIQEVNSKKAMEYSSYFVSLLDWIEMYTAQLKQVGGPVYNQFYSLSNSLKSFCKYLKSGEINLEELTKNFPGLVKRFVTCRDLERQRIQQQGIDKKAA